MAGHSSLPCADYVNLSALPAIHACERYYPAFQFVVWAGKSAPEAMSAAMFDTEGEA